MEDTVRFAVQLSEAGQLHLEGNDLAFLKFQNIIEANARRREDPERCGFVSSSPYYKLDEQAVRELLEMDPAAKIVEVQLSEAARDTLIAALKQGLESDTTPWTRFLVDCLQGRTIICK